LGYVKLSTSLVPGEPKHHSGLCAL